MVLWLGKKCGFIAQELADVEIDHSSHSHTKLVSYENPEKLEARPHTRSCLF